MIPKREEAWGGRGTAPGTIYAQEDDAAGGTESRALKAAVEKERRESFGTLNEES